MDIPDIKQQMIERERFAPDALEVRTAVVAGRGAPSTIRSDARRARVLAGAAAAVVILIALTIGLVRHLQPTTQVSSPRASAARDWVGINWTLLKVSQNGSSTDVPRGGAHVLQFAANGSLTGFGLCYGLTGHWTSAEQIMEMKPLRLLPHSCPFDSRGSEAKIIGKAVESLAAVGATGGHVEQQTLTLKSGPYELTYQNAGPTPIYRSSSDPSYPPGTTLTYLTSTPFSQPQISTPQQMSPDQSSPSRSRSVRSTS